MKTWIFLVAIFLSIATSCKKEPNTLLKIEGVTSDVRNGNAVSGVDVELTEQILEGGSFNSSFQFAADDLTDVNGKYVLEFPRQNAAEYKLGFDKSGYFNQVHSVNPDNVDPNEAYVVNASLIPEAYFTVHLINQNPFDEEDRILYRNLNAYFSCSCCNVAWVEALGTSVDTSFTCIIHGDFTVAYTWEVRRNDADSVYNASIFCPAFEETILTIEY